ncbi:MAG: NACHT domain-containing protein, partial [candidate division KSB1 bacterium]|nr:NACHT domain-containing protein [candidate division KSB1 bacterium]
MEEKWVLLVLLMVIIVAAAVTSPLWVAPLLKFIGTKSETIQGLADLIQILLWRGTAIIFIVGLTRSKKKAAPIEAKLEAIHSASQQDRKVIIHGPAQDAIIITGDKNRVTLSPKKRSDVTALRHAYLSHVFRTAKYLYLAGIDPKATSEAETRLELNAVYTALMTMSTEAHEFWQHGKGIDRETQYLSALEQLNRHRHLVVLGDPGSGKSTFVNFVAMCLAGEALAEKEANLSLLTVPIPQKDKEKEKPQQWDHGALIPIRVILRDFAARGLPATGTKATARHLWDFIANELAAATLAEYADPLRQELLKNGGLLLLDGLDEVPEADKRREQIKQAVEDFAAAYPRCRILVTSRTYAYQKQDWRLPDFAETILAPFNTGQIERFIDRWYSYIGVLRGLNSDDARGRAELLKRAVLTNDRLLALAERPLLLTLMASLHAWRGGSLPERREQLYADTVDLLLDWWESPKTVREADGTIKVLQPSLAEWLKVDRQRVRDQLNELAFLAHHSQPELVGTADIAEHDLVAGMMKLSQNPDVKPARLIEYLSHRAGLLLPRGVGIYTFPHRTFQEYLAACYLTDHDYPDKLAELLRAESNRWREVTLLAGAKAARGA